MNLRVFLLVKNGAAASRRAIPRSSFAGLRAGIVEEIAEGRRLAALFGSKAEGGGVEVYAVIADDAQSRLGVGMAPLPDEVYPALTPDCPQAHMFERELAEQYGVRPDGHPFLKPIRFHPSYRVGRDAPWPAPGVTDFYRVEGEDVHEVAVGPIHAGVIEPGHFRFQCHGERVFHLEISLGYQHRGVERALIGGPTKRTIHYIETLAGDTSIGHAVAHAQVMEGLARVNPPARAHAIRGVALELERLANHTGDLGALAGDVAYLPAASFCGRIRGDFLNMTAELCGNRFGRGLCLPGGVRFDLEPDRAARLLERLAQAGRDAREAIDLLWDTPTVVARFQGTGIVTRETAQEIGMVGVAARAAGVARDIRHDFAHGIYRYAHLPVMTASEGDVHARALVRWLEMEQSLLFVEERLGGLPGAAIRAEMKPLAPDAVVVALSEGWRGEICHVALTDGQGRFERYKVVDPSFHNWSGLALALRDGEISDFPLCNKSFSLSYCGHDL